MAILQAIEFNHKWISKVVTGEKTNSTRLGKREYTKGRAFLVNNDQKWSTEINITDVEYVKLCELSLDVVQSDGFNSIEEMFADMKNYYPDIESDSICTLVSWELK